MKKTNFKLNKIFLSLFLMGVFLFPISFTKAETQFYKSNGFEEGFQTPATAISFCDNLEYGGYNDWRLANETDIIDLPIGPTNWGGWYIDALPRTTCPEFEGGTAETLGWFMEASSVRYIYTINSQLEGNCPMMEEEERNVLCVRTTETAPPVVSGTDFDATGTQSMFDTAIANVTPTLAHGVPIIIGIGLGIWAIFFLVRKLRKNTK